MNNDVLKELQKNLGVEKATDWLNKDYSLPKDMTDTFASMTKDADAIIIFGDYDSDGICASKILTDGLKAVYPGKTVAAILPDRFRDGYGVSSRQVEKVRMAIDTLHSQGKDIRHPLFLTCDTGTTAIEAIRYMREQVPEAKILVTDHHLADERLSENEADAILNCHLREDMSFKDYCGAGLVFKLLEPMLSAKKYSRLKEHLGVYAGIATVADMVPMVEGNWVLARQGLSFLKEHFYSPKSLPAPIAMILHQFEIAHPAEIDEGFIAYKVSPLFNAAGRLRDNGAMKVLSFLEKPDEQKLEYLHITNETRKALVKSFASQLSEHPTVKKHKGNDPIWLFVSSRIPQMAEEGLCGLYAQEITKQFHCPAIVLTQSRINPEIVKGSARGVDGFDMYSYLKEKASPYLLGFGGHQAACGLSTTMKGARALSKCEGLYQAQDFYTKENSERKFFLLPPGQMLQDFIELQRDFAPFGVDNEAPAYTVYVDMEEENAQTMGKGEHIKVSDEELPVIHFFHKDCGLQDEDHFYGTGHVAYNYFRGKLSCQFLIDEVFDVEDFLRQTEMLPEEEYER